MGNEKAKGLVQQGLGNVIGTFPLQEGSTLTLSKLTLEDLAELEVFILAQRQRAFLQAAAAMGMPFEQQYGLLNTVATAEVTAGEAMRQTSTMLGIKFLLWRCVRHTSPDVDIDALARRVQIAEVPALTDLIGRIYRRSNASTEDESGKPPAGEKEVSPSAGEQPSPSAPGPMDSASAT